MQGLLEKNPIEKHRLDVSFQGWEVSFLAPLFGVPQAIPSTGNPVLGGVRTPYLFSGPGAIVAAVFSSISRISKGGPNFTLVLG